MHRNNFSATVLALAMLTSAPSLLAQHVRTDYDRTVDFTRYHTFSIYRVHSFDQIEENRLSADIAASLQRHGLQQVPTGGDLAVTAIGNVHNQQEYTEFYNGFGPGWGYGRFGGWYGWGGGYGYGGPAITSYTIPVGTLAIDLYDSSTHTLVFRGTSTQKISSHSDTNVRRDAEAIDGIFHKLPKHIG